ncbi:F-box DNA helicase 1-like [Ornithodoros turicata]|uniref:F-box DNA helicase 1-like n=1 Tax=Ornithodoros turicata TaxID=34597 RepID=UPI003139989B
MHRCTKVHFSYVDIETYGASDEGAAPLANPNSIRRSSRDPNRGLYPIHRSKRKLSQMHNPAPSTSRCGRDRAPEVPHFQTAAEVFVKMELAPGSSKGDSAEVKQTPAKRFKNDKCDTNSRSITSYFTVSPKKSHFKQHSIQQHEADLADDAHGAASPSNPFEFQAPQEEENNCTVESDDSDCVIVGNEYGLTGKHLAEQLDTADYFEQVPDELLEIIFAHLSLQDLLLTYSLVCVRWHRVISNPTFLQYRKAYYRYKATKRIEFIGEIEAECSLNSLHIENCLQRLIQFMMSFKKSPRGLEVVLRKHHKYDIAWTVLQQSFPDCISCGSPNLWCLLCVLVLVSESVWDVYGILQRSLSSTVDALAISEALYCIGTFLLNFKIALGINHGLHYRVYYALHLFENSWSGTLKDISALHVSHKGQQNIMKFGTGNQGVKYTHEQMRIINHELKARDTVLIIAFAGTGKTSTLVEYARTRPSMKFLNVVYNKSVEQLAKRTFPKNVECRTAHSLAFGKVGFRYRHKMTANFKVFDVKDTITKPAEIPMNHLRFTKLVLKTVESFMSSADEFITTAHVPKYGICDTANDEIVEPIELSASESLVIAAQAEAFWQRVIDPNDLSVRITHDGYLKKFQLERPYLGSYDCIFVDESQDCNPAMLDFILAQRCPKILVGDPHQQIYAFRKAIDALSSVPGTHKYYLTKSFRFGPEIGYVASCVLESLKGVHDKTIVGCTREGKTDGSRVGQICIIARSNLMLFNEAVRIICNGQHRDLGVTHVKAAFVGGFASYRFGQIEDIYRLKFNQEQNRITDPFVRKFANFQRLFQYARHAEDSELLSRLEFVEQHGHQVPVYVRTLTSDCKFSEHNANIVFTTAHKAKGLEFDTVILSEDFFVGRAGLGQSYHPTRESDREECNVLYVALTRAKRRLVMSRMLYFTLLQAQEKFEYLRTEQQALKELNQDTLTCCSCDNPVEPSHNLVLLRKSYQLSRHDVPGGPLCKNCAAFPEFMPLVQFPAGDVLFPQRDVGHVMWNSIYSCVL